MHNLKNTARAMKAKTFRTMTKAFTMMETLVVVSILAIIVAVAVPETVSLFNASHCREITATITSLTQGFTRMQLDGIELPTSITSDPNNQVDEIVAWMQANGYIDKRHVLTTGIETYDGGAHWAKDCVLTVSGGPSAPTLPGSSGSTILAPVVSAGPNQDLTNATVFDLAGTATDPNAPPLPLTYVWSQVSGPATALLSDPTILNPTVGGVSTLGAYVFRIAASNGTLTSTSEVTINNKNPWDYHQPDPPTITTGTTPPTGCVTVPIANYIGNQTQIFYGGSPTAAYASFTDKPANTAYHVGVGAPPVVPGTGDPYNFFDPGTVAGVGVPNLIFYSTGTLYPLNSLGTGQPSTLKSSETQHSWWDGGALLEPWLDWSDTHDYFFGESQRVIGDIDLTAIPTGTYQKVFLSGTFSYQPYEDNGEVGTNPVTSDYVVDVTDKVGSRYPMSVPAPPSGPIIGLLNASSSPHRVSSIEITSVMMCNGIDAWIAATTAQKNTLDTGTDPFHNFNNPYVPSGPQGPSSRWNLPPDNDNFANASPLVEGGAGLTGTVANSTREPGEPADFLGFGGGIWYSYQPASIGVAIFTIAPFNYATPEVAMFVGNSVTSLSTFVSARIIPSYITGYYGSSVLYMTPSDTVDIRYSASGNGSVHAGVSLLQSMPNDDFANATVFNLGDRIDMTLTDVATMESGEPTIPISQPQGTFWYKFTAPSAGVLHLSLTDGGIAVEVFQGTSLSTLTLVGTSPVASLTNLPGAGDYYIRISKTGWWGTVSLLTDFYVVPGNDMLANATPIPAGTPVSGTTFHATREAGEVGAYRNNTVWYSYAIPSSGLVRVTYLTDDYADVEIFTGSGTDVTALTSVQESVSYPSSPRVLSYTSLGGETLWIRCAEYWNPSNHTISVSFLSGSAPANDDFANATTLPIDGSNVTGGTDFATHEATEPAANYGGAAANSVWYAISVPSTGDLTVNMTPDVAAAVLEIFTGPNLTSLTSVAGQYANATGTATQVPRIFGAQTVYVRVSEGNNGTTSFTLSATFVAGTPPANDNFANAEVITDGTSTTGTIAWASIEVGETTPWWWAVSKSVWYKFTSPGVGLLQVTDAAGGSWNVIDLYSGSDINSLTRLDGALTYGGNSNTLTYITPTAGDYYVRVSDVYGSDADFSIQTSFQVATPPANDNFANAEVLPANGTASGTTQWGTLESGEPAPVTGTVNTVWYQYTAPSTGVFSVLLNFNNYGVAMDFFTGTDVTALTSVGHTDSYQSDAEIAHDVTAGDVIYVRVTSINPSSYDTFDLITTQGAVPVNDAYANASVLTGGTTTGAGNNALASAEPGEYGQFGNPNHSLWWVWTAPDTAAYQIDTTGTTFEADLEVYTNGATLPGAVMLQGSEGYPALFFLQATAGVTYKFRVDSHYNNWRGDVTLNVTETTLVPPVNDNFANATELTSSPATDTVDNTLATTEGPSEPSYGTGRSVWWKFTAPADGTVTVGGQGTVYPNVAIALLQGSSLATLTEVQLGYNYSVGDPTTFSASVNSGVTYYIMMESASTGYGATTVNLTFAPLPPPPTDWTLAAGFGTDFGPLTSNGAILAPGVSGNGAAMNGGYLQAPPDTTAGASGMTVSLWVNINNDSYYARIFDFGDGTWNWTAATNNSFYMYDAWFEQMNFPAMSTGTWHHFAVTYDASNVVTVYEDGAQVARQTFGQSFSWFNGGANDYFGHSQYPGDPLLDGSEDTILVYKRALSAGEVRALYQNPGIAP